MINIWFVRHFSAKVINFTRNFLFPRKGRTSKLKQMARVALLGLNQYFCVEILKTENWICPKAQNTFCRQIFAQMYILMNGDTLDILQMHLLSYRSGVWAWSFCQQSRLAHNQNLKADSPGKKPRFSNFSRKCRTPIFMSAGDEYGLSSNSSGGRYNWFLIMTLEWHIN